MCTWVAPYNEDRRRDPPSGSAVRPDLGPAAIDRRIIQMVDRRRVIPPSAEYYLPSSIICLTMSKDSAELPGRREMATPTVVMTDQEAGAVAAVRAFNRFYTNVIGLLRDGHLGSPYSLTEVRVLF